jgi:hypothetical protein
MRGATLVAAAVACLGAGLAACGGGGGEARPRTGDVGATAAAVPIDVALRPLGCHGLDGYAWRRGAGRDSFSRALAAEKKGDLPAVEREASAALAADPGHLEAAWMVAVARARLGKLDGVLAPLEIAASGDWAKWGERSIDLGVFESFRGTPAGGGWMRAAEGYRTALSQDLTSALVVVGRTSAPRLPRGDGERVEFRAELYGVLGDGRWIRLTRTGGDVVGALPASGRPLVAYAAYDTIARKGAASIRELRIGVVDLASGKTGREVALRDVQEVTLGWVTGGTEQTLVARVKHGGGPALVAIDWRQGTQAPTEVKPPRDGLRIRPLAAERRRLPIAGVTADWDEAGTASALRIDKSKKVVAPGGAMIDGHSVSWSPDRTRLAFATAADDPCGEGAAREVTVQVVDAATGRARPVFRSVGVPSPLWLDATRLAVVDGEGVRIVDAASGQELSRLTGGGGVATSVFGETRACASNDHVPDVLEVEDEEEEGLPLVP